MKTKKELNVIYYNYVMQCIPDIETLKNDFDFTALNDFDRVTWLIDKLDKQINYPYNKKLYPYLIDRIADNLQGLPSYFNLDFSNYDILQRLYEWEVIPVMEELKLKDRTEDRYISNWFRFWSNYILKVAKKMNINIDKLY